MNFRLKTPYPPPCSFSNKLIFSFKSISQLLFQIYLKVKILDIFIRNICPKSSIGRRFLFANRETCHLRKVLVNKISGFYMNQIKSKYVHTLPWNYQATLEENYNAIKAYIQKQDDHYKSQLFDYHVNMKAKYNEMKKKEKRIKKPFKAQIKKYREKKMKQFMGEDKYDFYMNVYLPMKKQSRVTKITEYYPCESDEDEDLIQFFESDEYEEETVADNEEENNYYVTDTEDESIAENDCEEEEEDDF